MRKKNTKLDQRNGTCSLTRFQRFSRMHMHARTHTYTNTNISIFERNDRILFKSKFHYAQHFPCAGTTKAKEKILSNKRITTQQNHRQMKLKSDMLKRVKEWEIEYKRPLVKPQNRVAVTTGATFPMRYRKFSKNQSIDENGFFYYIL